MTLQFHPLVFGLMLVVAAGTVAYTFLTSSHQSQSYASNQSIPPNCVGYDTNVRKGPTRKRRDVDQCCICLEKLHDLRRLPCRHLFHSNCISQWLVYNDTCPLCRQSEKL